MRVRFGELSEAELTRRARVSADAREAWQLLRAGALDGARAKMHAIDDRLELTLRRADAELAFAELSALDVRAWPLAALVTEQAPSDLGCALSLGRAPSPLSEALAEVRRDYAVELGKASLRAGFGRGHLLSITLGVPGGAGSKNEQNAAEMLVRRVLGDRLFETWVGEVAITPLPRGGPLRVLDVSAPRTTLNVSDLFDTVSAAVLGVLRGLPTASDAARSCADAGAGESERTDWTLLEVEPLEPGARVGKDDLALVSTCMPELLRCYLEGSPCSSRRFSPRGERFVFVSYVDDEQSAEQRLARRAEMEATLASALRGRGGVIGVGLGVQTTHIDLTLSDLDTGLSCLVSKLREVAAPPSTLVQFFDSELADEWLAIWPHHTIAVR